MNNLKQLIGQTVKANIWSEEMDTYIPIESKVLDVDIDTFHFENDWNEPIYIAVQVEPVGDLPKSITYDHFEGGVPLSDIVR